jgi:hypothetical protein
MTAIINIFDAIELFNITVASTTKGSVTPSVRNINELRNTLNSSDAPMRMLMVTGGNTEAREFGFIALGNLSKVAWVISDRLFWKPVTQGESLAENSEDLIKYIDAYMSVIRENRKLTSQSHIINARFIPGVYNWPETNEGTAYFGVDCVLTIEEIISR